ncbi:sugar transferase, partial [Lutibacter sp.]
MYKKIVKRLLDFIIACIGFILIFPILLLVTTVLIFTNKGNPFFFQIRPGLNEKLFKIIKFKTMNDKVDKEGNL